MDSAITNTLQYLVNEIKNDRAVLFVGSGLSLNSTPKDLSNPARMMLWSELMKKFCIELGFNESMENIYPIPKLIQIYENRFDLRRRNDIIRKAIPDEEVQPGEIHRRLFDLKLFPWNCVVTTNIDTLIERSLSNWNFKFTPIIYERDMPRITGVPIYKIHGTISDEDTWVFSEEEYHSRIQPLFIDKLRAIFSEKTVIFIGYSLNDPDLDAILYHVKYRIGHYQRNSFLILKESVTETREYWRKRKIEIISALELGLA
ncbi:SIR2 family protein [Leptospira santarosai]|uniref:SIR2 family protein n=1 Tax=Leptospira santarosai TaxID=28183 RepID=UPI0022A91938|nr:SIR2 family protein [Leptospira santarosai]UZN08168.1 SIR2 family protein [Leptospira santarosai]